MNEVEPVALTRILTDAAAGLHPGRRADRRPALFMLEVVAALLSVLALRDGIAGGSATSLEAFAAAALWGILLAALCGRSLAALAGPLSRAAAHQLGVAILLDAAPVQRVSPGQRVSGETRVR